MKIDDNSAVSSSLGNVTRSATTNGASAKSASKSNGSSSNAPADGIHLTTLGRMSAQVLQAADNARAERVQQLRALYGGGQHQVSAHEVSGAIIDSHINGW